MRLTCPGPHRAKRTGAAAPPAFVEFARQPPDKAEQLPARLGRWLGVGEQDDHTGAAQLRAVHVHAATGPKRRAAHDIKPEPGAAAVAGTAAQRPVGTGDARAGII